MGLLTDELAFQALDAQDRPSAHARLTIYNAGADSLAPIFLDPDLTDMTANPITADGTGRFRLSYLIDGPYDLVLCDHKGVELARQNDVTVQSDGHAGVSVTLPDVAALLADVTLAYDSQPGGRKVAPGTLIQVAGLNASYRVAAASAGDAHVETAGGVKLYTIPLWSGATGGVHTPAAWGAALDGIADDSAILQRIFDQGGNVFLPSGSVLEGAGAVVRVSGPVRVTGHGATLRNIEIKSDGAPQDVTFDGVTFTSTVTSGALPHLAFNTRNVDQLVFRDCVFDNVMVYAATDDTLDHVGVRVENCRFQADWTPWAGTSAQADLLTVLGYRHVLVQGCLFHGDNVNRFMKFSVGLTVPLTPVGDPVPSYRTRGVFISENTITGASSGANGKQVVDCFSGTSQMIFSNNDVRVTGYSAGVENKTGYSFAQAGTLAADKVCNNFFEVDKLAVSCNGSFGALDWTPNARNEILISGNSFRRGTDSDAMVSTRFYHDLKIIANSFLCADGIACDRHIEANSCETVTMTENTIENGAVLVSKSTSNQSGNSFDGQIKRLTFSNNVVRDYRVDAALMVKDCSAMESAVILGNTAETGIENSAIKGAFWLRASVIDRAVVCGNIANHIAASAKNKLVCTYSTITSLREEQNSWFAAARTLANDGTPTLMAVSYGSSVSGANVFKTGGTTDITDFDNGHAGQTLVLSAAHAVTVHHNASIKLAGSANFAMAIGDTLTLTQFTNGIWSEVARSVA